MIFADVLSLLQWWFVLFIITVCFLPLIFTLCSRFIDKGYIFAKILGMALLSYAIFFLGSIRLLPFTQSILIMLLTISAIACYWFNWGKLRQFFTRSTIPLFILEELMFLSILFFWTYVRSFAPDIHGLEKYMDYGFINSILRTEYFPPKDMWFTPFSINYYYFGHLVTAVLTRLSGIPSYSTFNFMVATCAALCFTACFSLGANLVMTLFVGKRLVILKIIVAGLLTASLVTFSGNLHTIYSFFKPYENENPVPFWQLQPAPIKLLAFDPLHPLASFSSIFPTFPNSYWYPNATRFIHNTIHEFPIYSWVVSDLHGHVLDIPFVLLTIGILLSFFLNSEQSFAIDGGNSLGEEHTKSKKSKQLKKSQTASSLSLSPFGNLFPSSIFDIRYLLLVGFLLAVMYMTNAWDGLIYLLLSAGVLFFLSIQHAAKNTQSTRVILQRSLPPTVISSAVVFVSFIIFSLPFSIHFKPFVSGVGVLCAPKALTAMGKLGPLLFEADHCQHSPLWQLAILYGFFMFFTICFLVFINKQKKLRTSDIFVFLLICLSFLLIIIPEFIYVKDIYPAHYRANTMFKLVFQSFMMLSVCVGYIIVRLLSAYKQARKTLVTTGAFILFFLSSLTLLSLVFIYPFLSTKAYYNNLQTSLGINGTKYLDTLYPDDAKAITWINHSIPGQPVILEAQGDSYTDYGRISTNTGLPTVLGWTVHEWLWRGTYDIPAPRIVEVQNLYESDDLNLTKSLIKKYNIEYVYIGNLEKQKYSALNEEKWKQLGKVVYQSGDTTIYRL